jgi:hypothetical protein
LWFNLICGDPSVKNTVYLFVIFHNTIPYLFNNLLEELKMYKKIFLLLCFFLLNNSVYADGFNDYIHFGNMNDIYNINHNLKFKVVVRTPDAKIAGIKETEAIKPNQAAKISEKYFGVKQGTIDFYVSDATTLSGYKCCIFNYPFAVGVGMIVNGRGANDNITCNIDDEMRNG